MADTDLLDRLRRGWRDSPAFPNAFDDDASGYAGISRREYLAARALQGALANPALADDGGDRAEAAAALALRATDRLLELLYQNEIDDDQAALEASDSP